MSRYKFSALLGIPALALLAFGVPQASAAAAAPVADRSAVLETRMARRDLWGEHNFRIRS
jgi:hypothetical protein